MAITITDVLTEYGAYYKKNPENLKRLYKLLMAKSRTQEIFTPMITEDTVFHSAKSVMTRILQPFQKAFTPISPLTIKPVTIQLFEMKADLQETPHELQASWLGFLTGEDIDVKKWPFVRWFLEVHCIPQIHEDYELNEVYKGVYAAPTPGTPGAVSTSMNGLGKIIADAITAGSMTAIVLGAPDADNAVWVEQVETFADAINQNYWDIPMTICMNKSLERRFHRGYQTKYGKNVDYKTSSGSVDFSSLDIKGLPSMTGRNRIFCTPKANIVQLTKKPKNLDTFQIENVDRTLKAYTDFWRGVGFLVNEAVFPSDQV